MNSSEAVEPTRRSLVAAAALAAAAVPTLAACGSSSSTNSAAQESTASAVSQATTDSTTAAASGASIALSEIPVGGAVVRKIAGRDVVISHPNADTVVAFDAACTHQGCPVQVSGQRLTCPCHGSEFDSATGEVLKDPAKAPLAKLNATISGTNVVVG